jgi:hypothetical protein
MSSTTPFPKPGSVLWGIDVALERDVFRNGTTSKPSVEFLRYSDLKIKQMGRIPEDQVRNLMIDPGYGISFFLERKIPEGLVLFDASADSGQKKEKLHWWAIDQNQPLPSGLTLIYDGDPPGHCTLTVSRQMLVSSFLDLVSNITFSLTKVDVVVRSKPKD